MIPAPPTRDEPERLRALHATGLLDTAPEQAYDDLTTLAASICETPIAGVSLIDFDRQWFKSVVGARITHTDRDIAFCAHAIHERTTFLVSDAKEDVRFRDNPFVVGEPHIRSFAAAPLIDAEGRALGGLCVLDHRPREMRPEQIRCLEALARQVMRLIEQRARTLAAEKERAFADAIIDTSNSLVCVLDRNGYIVRCNRRCEELSGFGMAEVRGMKFWDVVLEGRHRAAMMAAFVDLQPSRFPNTFQNEWATRREGYRRIAWNNSALLDADGAVEHVVCVGIDITDRDRAERDRDRLFELAPDFMAVVGPQRRYLRVNAAFAHFLGFRPADLVGRSSIDLVHPVDLERIAARPVRRDGEYDEYELRVRRHDGEYRWVAWRVTRAGPDGLVFGCGRDLTDRKKIERMKDEFVSTVSHELRTPLTAIRGALGLLEGGVAGTLSSQAVELIQLGRSNCDRLVRLVNDILDLEKIEAGQTDLTIRSVATAPLIARTVDDLRSLAASAGVELTIAPSEPMEVLADEDRFVQVLVNLVSNAIKFSPPGGKVVVSMGPGEPGRVRFSVADEGPGIAPDQRSLLFKRFSQLDSSDSRKKGGTGLGLAISRAIVERHGGEIGVDTPGVGSVFWFELPTAPRVVPTIRPRE